MRNKRDWIIKHLHLLISIAIVVPTGIVYGATTSLYLNIQVDTVDLANMLKANMFLYFGISAVWFLGIWKSNYWAKSFFKVLANSVTLRHGIEKTQSKHG